MKKYKRSDFVNLPPMTIYSRIDERFGEFLYGLYCKTSGGDWENDWNEQDLIGECGFPNDITEGGEAAEYILNLRDTFQDFETDLYCAGRDGMFEDSDCFVVWDKNDITKLRNYLNDVLEFNQ